MLKFLKSELALIAQLLVAMLWIAAALILLAGCSVIAPRVGPQLAKGVNRYCEQPELERALVRESINAQIAPHRLELTCVVQIVVPAPDG